MNYKGHVIFGIIVSVLFVLLMRSFMGWYELSLTKLTIYAVIIVFFSLLPDCDHKMGKMTWFFLFISLVGLTYGFFFDRMILGASILFLVFTYYCAAKLPHRGFIHSITFGAVASLLLLIKFNIELVALGFIAFYSHLLADGYVFKIWK